MFGKINQNEFLFIFVCSLAREEDNNESLRKLINNDLENLVKPQDFYNGVKIVPMQFLKIVKMDNRPERSSHTGIGHHNGTYTICFGYLCVKDNKLHSCTKCSNHRKKYKFT